jgi:hypothetical protein
MLNKGAKMYKIIDNDIDITGTSLQGYIVSSFDNLVEQFGKPAFDSTVDGESDKVHTQWTLEFENEEGDYVVATIYDWKEDSAYNSRVGEYRWHIGGNGYDAVEAVTDFAEVTHA